MRGFLERHLARQLPELVAADDQLTGLAVDVAEARLGCNDAIQPAGFYRRVDETSLTSW